MVETDRAPGIDTCPLRPFTVDTRKLKPLLLQNQARNTASHLTGTQHQYPDGIAFIVDLSLHFIRCDPVATLGGRF